MEKWKAKYAFHFPTPSTATKYFQKSMRYTNNPTGTKDRALHHHNRVPHVRDGLIVANVGFCSNPPGHFFFEGVFAFLQGVFEKTAVKRGFLMVNLWWNRGDLW